MTTIAAIWYVILNNEHDLCVKSLIRDKDDVIALVTYTTLCIVDFSVYFVLFTLIFM